LYNDVARSINLLNVKGTQFTLTNPTVSAGGTIKMALSTVNLSEADFKSNSTLTAYSTQFGY
jgi:hypothetical protein